MASLSKRHRSNTNLYSLVMIGLLLVVVAVVATSTYADDDTLEHDFWDEAPWHDNDDDGDLFPFPVEDAQDGHGIFPADNDPSRFGDLVIGDLPEGRPDANEGSFEGGNTGTVHDAEQNNVLTAEEQRDAGTFNVPTNGPPSPLFGAEAFTQQMLRFE